MTQPTDEADEADETDVTAGVGRIEDIHLVADEGGDPRAVRAATATVGLGLEGDRNVRAARAAGKDAVPPEAQVTLIAAEAIEAATAEHGIVIAPGVTRRNVTTRGVDLDAAVGRTLRVGEAVLRGVEPCHPCGYLERTSGIAGITRALVGRGGLRCEVLEGGLLAVGDRVEIGGAVGAGAGGVGGGGGGSGTGGGSGERG